MNVAGTGCPVDAVTSEAEELNRGCFCLTLDRTSLAQSLDREVAVAGFADRLNGSHPTLFSNVPVFVPSATLAEMAQIVTAVEAATRLPQYRALALSHATPGASRDFGPVGDGVVLTPNPHVHALFADKRNLAALSDIETLRSWGLAPDDVETLQSGVLKTVVVLPSNIEDLWRERRGLFFKPARGYASKAAYRGEKLTHKVWADISAGEYVAQAYAAPSSRGVAVDGEHTELKVDVRLYTYAGAPLLAAARLYRGQTTNMRTPGGGFAPVLEV